MRGLQPLGPRVQRLRLNNYERVARPSQYMEEIQARMFQAPIVREVGLLFVVIYVSPFRDLQPN